MTNAQLLYLAISIAWSAASFLIGYFVGVKARPIMGARMTSLIEDHPPTEDPARTAVQNPKKRPWYKDLNVWTGGLVALIGVVTLVLWLAAGRETRQVADETKRIAECQVSYANGFADALDARTRENWAVAEGQDRLWLIFQEAMNTAPTPDIRDRFRVQLNEYLAARAKAKAAQTANPYPPAPRDLCR